MICDTEQSGKYTVNANKESYRQNTQRNSAREYMVFVPEI
jgi:hypothetical protein